MTISSSSVTRRSFIVGGSAAGVAVAHTALAAPVGAAPATAPTIPVGFVGPVGGAPVTSGRHRVVPGSLTAPDRQVTGLLAVTIHGLRGAPAGAPVQLDAMWPGRQAQAAAPFFAWQSGSPGVRYVVHASRSTVPTFTLRVGDVTTTTRFVTRAESGVAGLRRGTYLLGLDRNAWTRPRTVSLDDPAGGMPASVLVTIS